MKYIIALAFMILCNGYVTGQTDTVQVDSVQLKPAAQQAVKQIIDQQKKLSEEFSRLQNQLNLIIMSTLDDPSKYMGITEDNKAIIVKTEGK